MDDGSTDGSSVLCDNIADLDPRVISVHQENKGQATARNVGINLATGKWYCFVDSDDAIHPQMIEKIMSSIERYQVAIGECGYVELSDIILGSNTPERNCFLYRTDEKTMLDDRINCWIICGKIIDRDIVKNHMFLEGKYYEDNAVILNWLYSAKAVATYEEALYYYRINPKGVTKRPFTIRQLDYLWALEERLSFCKRVGYKRLYNKTIILYIDAVNRMSDALKEYHINDNTRRSIRRRCLHVICCDAKLINPGYKFIKKMTVFLIGSNLRNVMRKSWSCVRKT